MVRDSFDIGSPSQETVSLIIPPNRQDAIAEIISNPGKLASLLGMSGQQAKNVSQILTSAGAGLGAYGSMKLLERTIGKRLAATLGGAAGGYLAALMLERLLEDK